MRFMTVLSAKRPWSHGHSPGEAGARAYPVVGSARARTRIHLALGDMGTLKPKIESTRVTCTLVFTSQVLAGRRKAKSKEAAFGWNRRPHGTCPYMIVSPLFFVSRSLSFLPDSLSLRCPPPERASFGPQCANVLAGTLRRSAPALLAWPE